MKHITFVIQPYPITVHVCSLDYPIQTRVHVDPDIADFDKSNSGETFRGRSKRGGHHVVISRLPLEYCEETLWHESMHIAAEVIDLVGGEITAAGLDTLIYPTEHVVRTIKRRFYLLGKKKDDKA